MAMSIYQRLRLISVPKTWHPGACADLQPEDETSKSRAEKNPRGSGKARSKADPWLDAGVITLIGADASLLCLLCLLCLLAFCFGGRKGRKNMTQWGEAK